MEKIIERNRTQNETVWFSRHFEFFFFFFFFFFHTLDTNTTKMRNKQDGLF